MRCFAAVFCCAYQRDERRDGTDQYNGLSAHSSLCVCTNDLTVQKKFSNAARSLLFMKCARSVFTFIVCLPFMMMMMMMMMMMITIDVSHTEPHYHTEAFYVAKMWLGVAIVMTDIVSDRYCKDENIHCTQTV